MDYWKKFKGEDLETNPDFILFIVDCCLKMHWFALCEETSGKPKTLKREKERDCALKQQR